MSLNIRKIDLESPVLANCYILTDSDTSISAVVDPGYFGDCLKNEILKYDLKVKYIILTHGHFDHIIGAYDLKCFTGAEVMIHSEDAICLENETYSLNNAFPDTVEQKCFKPDIVLSDDSEIKIGHSILRVMHTPGHSPGSCCFINYNDSYIISGDTLFCHTVGRTDFLGGDDEMLRNSIIKLINMEGDFDVYPGHNIKTTLQEERSKNFYIRRMNKN